MTTFEVILAIAVIALVCILIDKNNKLSNYEKESKDVAKAMDDTKNDCQKKLDAFDAGLQMSDNYMRVLNMAVIKWIDNSLENNLDIAKTVDDIANTIIAALKNPKSPRYIENEWCGLLNNAHMLEGAFPGFEFSDDLKAEKKWDNEKFEQLREELRENMLTMYATRWKRNDVNKKKEAIKNKRTSKK